MNIIMIYDQIQSGAGTKDDVMVSLQGKKTAIGPAIMMEQYLKEIGANVVACLYCGTGTFETNPDDISRKFCAMVKKIKADVVICGPCFNYLAYAKMASKICIDLKELVNVNVVTAMSKEMSEIIEQIKEKVPVVKMPKKGEIGLNESLKNICLMANALYKNEKIEEIKNNVCY